MGRHSSSNKVYVYIVLKVMIYYAVPNVLYNTYLNFSSGYFYCLPFLLAFGGCPPLSSMIVPRSILKSYDALLFNHNTSYLNMFCPFSVITLTRTTKQKHGKVQYRPYIDTTPNSKTNLYAWLKT
jgi:hypothetical protein